ncbi:MAG: deoxyhypusine synthase family protein [Candidatus Bathyarchaeia archaeon]
MKKLLKQSTVPIAVSQGKSIDQLLAEMKYTAFQGRKLGEAVDIWSRMLKKRQTVIWFGLAGAMIPAGMRRVLSYIIKKRMVDVVVATGANFYHDAFEVSGGKHYIGAANCDDRRLRKQRIDRIYDVYVDEDRFYAFDRWLDKVFSAELMDDYPYSSREILWKLGKHFYERYGEVDSVLVNSYRRNVPVFCPALGDSSLGFSLMFANRKRGRRIILNTFKDVDESSRITEKAKATGVVYVGGGTPKNFIQQTAVISSYQTRHDRSHSFAVQFTTDLPVWGGLSGCTFEEAQSWGKISANARMATCYVDASIALPIVVHALAERFKRFRREIPLFDWDNGDLKLTFEKTRL